jgi:ATP-binding cassette subfamily B protein/subfamily B ATP-binding cassette protein MsbA
MKNFLRALRCSWPYRGRLILSVLCAVFAAIFWGLTLGAVYPVLQGLTKGQSLHQWVEEKLAKTKEDILALEQQVNSARQTGDPLPPEGGNRKPAWDKEAEKRERTHAEELAKAEGRLAAACRKLNLYLLAKKYINLLLPDDCFRTLAWIIGLVVIGVAFKGFFEFCQEGLVGSVVNLSLFDLRNRFYRNVIHLDVNNFSEEGTHELMARFTNDMEMLGTGTRTLFGKVVAEPLRALACVVGACWISWQLTLLFLVLVPLALYVLTKAGRIMKRATRRLLERMSNIYKILQETFLGIRVVKAFTMEPYERRRFHSATKDYYHKAMRVVMIDALASPIVELLGVAAVALAFVAGAYLVLNTDKKPYLLGMQMTTQRMDAEELLQFYAFLAAIADPIRKLSSVYTRIQSGAAAADRIFAFLDRQPRVLPNSNARRLERHHEAIEFRDVCFSYEPGRPILTDIHLTVRFGETVALVGKNGCGKTTLVGLIPRFFDPDHGSILIDDNDIRHLNLRSLRQQIGIVTQETTLFDDTIFNNIAYGNRRAGSEAVENAAKQAYAHDFIMALRNGYQTRVGEAGAKLSGGQKQRLALARAILRDPSILILDEFTSSADAESEGLIHRALRDFMRNRTTFVITHRLNTLEVADRIVVVDSGRIEAVGRHAELLHNCSIYQRLHEAQFQRLSA